MLDKGSAVDAQPIKGFSHRSLVSNSIFHFFVLFTPDCMLLRAGTKILTFLVLICSTGTPVKVVISNFSSTVMSCASRAGSCASLHVEVLNDLVGTLEAEMAATATAWGEGRGGRRGKERRGHPYPSRGNTACYKQLLPQSVCGHYKVSC